MKKVQFIQKSTGVIINANIAFSDENKTYFINTDYPGAGLCSFLKSSIEKHYTVKQIVD